MQWQAPALQQVWLPQQPAPIPATGFPPQPPPLTPEAAAHQLLLLQQQHQQLLQQQQHADAQQQQLALQAQDMFASIQRARQQMGLPPAEWV